MTNFKKADHARIMGALHLREKLSTLRGYASRASSLLQ